MEHDMKKLSGFISIALLVTVSAKALGMLREMLQARVFGASADMDAFSLASSSTIVLFTTLAYALCIAAIPILSGLPKEESFKALNNLLVITGLGASGLAVSLYALNSIGVLGLAVGGTTQYAGLAARLIPLLPLIIVIYMLLSLLQSRGHYALQGALSLPYNLAILLFLVFSGTFQMDRFVLVVALAWLLQLAVLIPALVKEEYRLRIKPDFHAPYLKRFYKTALSTVLTTSVFYWLFLTDIRFVSQSEQGAASLYYYADKLFTPIATTLLYSISAVVFPRLGKMASEIKEQSKESYATYVAGLLESALKFILPISALICAFAPDISRVLFAGGSFQAADAVHSGRVLSLYALGLGGFFLLDMMSKAWFALRNIRFPSIVVLLVILVNGLLDLVLTQLFPNVLELPALTTALCMIGGGISLTVALLRKTRQKLKKIYITAGLSVILGAALSILRAQIDFVHASKLSVMIGCFLLGAAGFAVYWLMLRLLGRKI
jgi:putative peptidoglycan lipid II flippase